MINEILEVEDYLAGRNISKYNLYRTVYLIAKYYLSQGIQQTEIRTKIFEWANRNGFYPIKYDVNDMIIKAMDDKKPLTNPPNVRISAEDVEKIKTLFDGKYVRYAAFGLLCYAKVHANKRGEFSVSAQPFANWLGISKTYFQGQLSREISLFGYAEITKNPQHKHRWGDGSSLISTRYRILVPFENAGEYEVSGNNVSGLYEQIFETKF
ncbi:MAG: hypothetical protein PHX74_05655 [Candidatus Sumerlaeales bacterium]|nr:hypothetical protein [Candidatus Sumerlaeales bacterium]